MADSEHHSGHNGRSWHGEWGRESAGLIAGGLAATAVGVGAFTFLGELAPKPIHDLSRVVSKICVEPFLDTIEWGLQKVCKLKECQPDFTKSRQERAQQYAEYLTLFTISAAAGLTAEWGMRKMVNNGFGIKGATNGHRGWKNWLPNGHDLRIICLDRGIEVGAILAMNTIFAKHSDKAISDLSGYAQKKFHWPKDRADKFAQMMVLYQGPDWLGLSSAITYAGVRHYNMRNK